MSPRPHAQALCGDTRERHHAREQYETAGALLPEYERAVKLDESVLRFLVVVSEGLPAKPEAAPAVIAADVVDEIEEEEA